MEDRINQIDQGKKIVKKKSKPKVTSFKKLIIHRPQARMIITKTRNNCSRAWEVMRVAETPSVNAFRNTHLLNEHRECEGLTK